MRYVILVISTTVLVASGCRDSGTSSPPIEADLALVGVDVLDVSEGRLLENRTILILGTRISAMGSRDSLSVPSGTARLDGVDGKVVTPGLIDAHIHLRDADTTALLDYLAAGVTTAREMNGRPFLLEWRDRIDAGELIGPTLRVAAPTLANFSSPREGYPTPESRSEANAVVSSFRATGYDWIKVYSFLGSDPFLGVMEEANRLAVPVAGHVPIEAGLRVTMSSGIGSIEHLTEYVSSSLLPESRDLDEEDFRSVFGAGEVNWAAVDSLVDATVAAGTWNVPTLVWFDRNLPVPMAEAAWADPGLRTQGETNRREIVRRLHSAGALLAVGTDSDAGGDLPASAFHDEMAALVEAGLRPLDVIRLATVGGAALLGMLDDVGTLSAGKRADLLILPCNPLDDLGCVRRSEAVVARGRLVTRPSGSGMH